LTFKRAPRRRTRLRTREVARPTRQNKHLRRRLLSRSSPGPFEDLLYVRGLRGSACTNTIGTETGARRAFYFRLRHTLKKHGWSIDRFIDPPGILPAA